MKSLRLIAPISSMICAIHCVVTPLAMAILPYVSISLFITEFYDWLLLSFSLLFNIGNLCFGFKKHKSYKALKYLGIGIGFLLVAKLEHHHEKIHHGFDPFDVEILLFNRWGQVIWESHNVSFGWDGTYQGLMCPAGIYVYKITYGNVKNDSRSIIIGHLTLLK